MVNGCLGFKWSHGAEFQSSYNHLNVHLSMAVSSKQVTYGEIIP